MSTHNITVDGYVAEYQWIIEDGCQWKCCGFNSCGKVELFRRYMPPGRWKVKGYSPKSDKTHFTFQRLPDVK